MGLLRRLLHKRPVDDPMDAGAIPLPKALPFPTRLAQFPPPRDVDCSDPLPLGVYYHEQNLLDISVYYFSVAASQNSPLGLFLYGMSVRHGWGCPKDERQAFNYLSKAAESAYSDLNFTQGIALSTLAPSDSGWDEWDGSGGEGGRGGNANPARRTGESRESARPDAAVRSRPYALPHGNSFVQKYGDLTPGNVTTIKSIATDQFTLAIYELAICYKQGWGVPRNKTTAVYYFTIAANLGDADAQVALADCYLRGEGVKMASGRVRFTGAREVS